MKDGKRGSDIMDLILFSVHVFEWLFILLMILFWTYNWKKHVLSFTKWYLLLYVESGVRCVLHTKLILCIKGPTYKTACDAEVHLKKTKHLFACQSK